MMQPLEVETDAVTAATGTTTTNGMMPLPAEAVEALQQLQQQQQQNQRKKRRRRPFPSTPAIVQCRYVALSTVAVVLAVTCPGNTILWSHNLDVQQIQQQKDMDYQHLNVPLLCSLVFVYLILLRAFFEVHGSNPGYLTGDVMERFDECHADDLNDDMDDDEERNGSSKKNDLLPLMANDENNYNNDDKPRRRNSSPRIAQQRSCDGGGGGGSPFSPHNSSGNLSTTMTTSPPTSASSPIPPPITTCRILRRRKMCNVCRFHPPLRSHHCKVCNKCVATFDHHCDLIGNCIGERNRCRFLFFLAIQFTGFMLLCHIVNSSLYGFTTLVFIQPKVLKGHVMDAVRVVVSKVLLYILSITATLMIGLHTVLALTNATTFEFSKSNNLEYLNEITSREYKLNPFGQGLVRNLQLFCCLLEDSSSAAATPSAAACCCCPSKKNQTTFATSLMTTTSTDVEQLPWMPMAWKLPDLAFIEYTNKKDGSSSSDNLPEWWENPWRNKHWSCCC